MLILPAVGNMPNLLNFLIHYIYIYIYRRADEIVNHPKFGLAADDHEKFMGTHILQGSDRIINLE